MKTPSLRRVLLLLALLLAVLPAAEGDALTLLVHLRPEDGVALAQHADAELRRGFADPRALEARLLAGLADGAATDYGCQTACLRLARCASAASVPVLAPWLALPARSHAARLVLQEVPGAEATTALCQALGATTGDLRVGIIVSLGRRGDAHAVAALVPLIADAHAPTAEAALRALGGIGDAAAVTALEAAPPSAIRDEALLAAAARPLTGGDRTLATAILRGLADPARASAVRGQALAMLAGVDGDLLLPLLLEALTGDRRELVTGAVRGLVALPGPTATMAIANRLPSLTAEQQLIACGILLQRHDGTGADAVAGLLAAEDPAVRRAALGTLAVIGGERQLDRMLALGDDKALAKAVRAAVVEMVPREAVDQALLARLDQGGGTKRDLLLAILTERRCRNLFPLLLADARSADAVRAAQALPLLGELAATADLPALLDLLVARQGQDEVRDAVAALLRRHGDTAQAGTALAARWDGATVELRRSLLRLFAVQGQGLPLLRSAFADPALADSALLAAAEWPSAAVAEDLATAIHNSRNPNLRQTGLRGLGRMLELPDHPAHERSAQLLHQALGAGASADDRRTMLAALANHPDDQSLELALEFLGDPEVRGEAQSCLLTLAKAMAGTQSDKLHPVLLKLKDSDDKAVRKEAERLLKGQDNP